MKKMMSIGFTTLLSAGVITTMSIFSLNNAPNKKNDSKNIHSTSLYNDTTSSSSSKNGVIKDQVNNILNTVSQKTFLGDINAATNHGDLTSVDVSKLIDLDNTTGQIIPAYLKVDGKFTSDINEAKRSHLQNPVIKYLDSNGKIYDTEIEAYNAMILDEESYANGIAYYEIQDLSVPDKPVYKINPLNKKDVNKLKEIAARNMLIDNTNFSIDRLSVDLHKNETVYSSTANFIGKSDAAIQNILNDFAYNLVTPIRENMPLNVKVVAVPDKPQIILQRYVNGGNWFNNRYERYAIDIGFTTYGYNSEAMVYANEVRNDTQYFRTENQKWADKFQFQYYAPFSTGDYKPIYDFISLNNQTILGGQRLHFILNNATEIAQKFKYYYVPKLDSYQTKTMMLTNNDFGFLGRGSKASGYFQFEINQNSLNANLYNKNTTFYNDLKRRSQEVTTSITNNLTNSLKEWGFPDNEAMQTAKDIGNAAGEILLDNILGSNTFRSGTLWTGSEIEDTLNKLNYTIINKLDAKLKSQGKLSLTETLDKYLKLKYQARDTLNSASDIYVVNYNGVPLFQLNQSLVSDLFNNSYFKTNPLDAVKKSFKQKLQNNYVEYSKTLVNSMINISNLYKVKNNKVELTKNAITNYETGNEFNFGFDQNTSNPNGFDASIKLFDEAIFTENNITSSQLEKQLNRREDESEANLNNAYGTFEAVYQYNNALRKILNNPNASDTLKKSVNDNAIKSTNDVVVLYNKSKQPQTIKFGKYANYGTKFNVSLTEDSNRVINSTEALTSEFYLENLGVPTKQYNFYDYSGKLVSSELINSVNGSFNESEKNAWENALKKIDVQADSNYVFFKETNKETLVKNQITKLYVCFIPSDSGQVLSNYSSYKLRADSTTNGTYYGFTSYDDLKGFVENYVNTVNGILPPLITPNPPVTNSNAFYREVLIGTWSSLGIIIILAGVSSLYFYNISQSTSKLKTKNLKHNKYNSLKFTSALKLR